MENLLRQREELQTKIRELDDLSTTGTEKILQAIKNQRWYFFTNNDKILFDRDTALIWANLNYFPCFKYDSLREGYSGHNSYQDVKNLLQKINAEKWGEHSNWRIPTPFELCKVIAGYTFPFCGPKVKSRIKDEDGWCVNHNGSYRSKFLLDHGKPTDNLN